MNNKVATLQDVAKAAGVSVSTVSKILTPSSNASFRESTREKVLKAVEDLDYSPNTLARGIVTGKKTPIIGVFIPNILNPFFSELINELNLKLHQAGYMITLCTYKDEPERFVDYIKFLRDIQASGAVFCAASINSKPFIDELKTASKYHLAMVSCQTDYRTVDTVETTDFEGTYEIIDYLIKNGHRKIGFIGYNFDLAVMKARLKGYKAALKDNDIRYLSRLVKSGLYEARDLYEVTLEMISQSNRPTAIHCANDMIAFEVYKAIQDYGLKIPDDISVTSFDGLALSSSLYPPLTTVTQPIKEMAEAIVMLLLEQLNGRSSIKHPKHIVLKHIFEEHCSVKKI